MSASSAQAKPSIRPLRGVVKDYAWGIRGNDSRVARYALEAGAIQDVDPAAPYAELWLGTHPKGPSTLEDGEPLEGVVGGALPFLFKILSAGKALSIQAHPDKQNAERLHAADPDHYADENHKPELAIALTPFEAMCGFRRLEEIAHLLRKHPEFAACVSSEAKLKVFMARSEEAKKAALQDFFASFMHCPAEVSAAQLRELIQRLQQEQSKAVHPHPHEELPWERKCARAVLRLHQQFPGDPGAMAPLFLNYLLIAPGESFFMAANEPHAYVAGEIIECMACSDNVVRAGLTPKFKDVENLVNLLTYTMGGPNIDAGAVVAEDPRMVRYTPPVPEFEVVICTVSPGEDLTLPDLSVPAVMMVIEGTGSGDAHVTGDADLVLRPGRSFYLPPDCPPMTLTVNQQQRGCLRVALAHENLHVQLPTSIAPSSGKED
uniref:mannose-6-phosphate isomerase n=1 Tax=Rhizochromulina marina TaxID=1034831 RepID=A0A6U0ZIS5_9STRA